MPAFAASFTTEQRSERQCGRCKEWFPAGTEMHYLQDGKDRTKAGRHVCHCCHDYYLSKPSTVLMDDKG